MAWMTTMRAVREDERFRNKVVEMATEFCLEAAVLISVLGILEAAIAWKGFPPLKDILFSGSIGGGFFVLGCIIQFQQTLKRHESEAPRRDDQ